MITIIVQKEYWFLMWFLLMFHCACVTQIIPIIVYNNYMLLCKIMQCDYVFIMVYFTKKKLIGCSGIIDHKIMTLLGKIF